VLDVASERLAGVVGREEELARVHELFEAGSQVRALVLAGDPGIGKTTLWEAGIDAAREQGLRVLSARPSGAEAQLSFSTLIDLCDGIDTSALEGVPAPSAPRSRWRCCARSRPRRRQSRTRSASGS
jgi:hypothetical protein